VPATTVLVAVATLEPQLPEVHSPANAGTQTTESNAAKIKFLIFSPFKSVN